MTAFFAHYRNERELKRDWYISLIGVWFGFAIWILFFFAWFNGMLDRENWLTIPSVLLMIFPVMSLRRQARTDWARRHDPILAVTEDRIRVLDDFIEAEDIISIAWDSDRTTGFRVRSGQTVGVHYQIVPKRLRAEARAAVVAFGRRSLARSDAPGAG